MADDEMNTSAADTAVAEENLIGRQVRINQTAKDMGTDNPHMWAGLYGEISKRTPFGAYMVTIGKKAKQFDLGDLELLPAAGDTPTEAAPAAVAIDAPSTGTRLVLVHPLMAINSLTNPRRRRGLDMDSLRTLADNITTHGLAQPILVRPLPPSRLEDTAQLDPRPAYEVIAGERRWRAAQLAELAVVPLFVREMTDQAVLEIQLVENIEREDLDAMEEAEGFALLRDKLGYTVDQIAERIGKGKGASYVRKTMKLLDLTPESRDAMYEGHLGRSTGLLVARYPAERQAAVVAYIKSQAIKGPTGMEPAPFRGLAPALHARFNTDLGKAAFDISDPTLVMGAGACIGCPKRTGEEQDLFGEADRATRSSCTDEACFASKKVAHIQRIHVQAKADGMEVIDGEDALKLLPSSFSSFVSGYTRLTDVIDTLSVEGGEDREVTVEDALRKMGRKAPKPVMFINPHTGAAIKVVPDEVAEKLMPERPEFSFGEGNGGSGRQGKQADTSPPEEIAWRDSMVRRAALFRAFDIIRSGERTVDELRRTALALMACSVDDVLPHTEDYLGWSADLEAANEPYVSIRERVMAMQADELGQLIAMASLELVLTSYPHTENAKDVLGHYGIDILAVRDKVAEDLARQADQPDHVGGADDDEPVGDSE